MTDAAAASGRTSASIDIGALPLTCETAVAHAPLVSGQGVVGVLKRERLQLDRANAVIADCAALHEDLREHLLASPLSSSGTTSSLARPVSSAPPLSGKPLAGAPR